MTGEVLQKTSENVDLKMIGLDDLKEHPQNPRAVIRLHVVRSIVEGIKQAGRFKPNHAITVRPVNGHYEVISGHHRVIAARTAKLDEIPCWVEEMDDDTAFYELVRSNSQGELSPLEIGLHALDYVKLDKRGLGAEGKGLKGYAEGVGYKPSSVTEYRNAANVYRTFINSDVRTNELSINSDAESLLSKASHLSAIHKADQSCWYIITTMMLEKGWTVADTAKAIKSAQEFEIAPFWESLFLSRPVVTWRALDYRHSDQ